MGLVGLLIRWKSDYMRSWVILCVGKLTTLEAIHFRGSADCTAFHEVAFVISYGCMNTEQKVIDP